MNDVKEKTALTTSVGADERQPFQTNTKNIIPASTEEINDVDVNSSENLEEMFRQMQRMASPYYLHTVSMTELYQTSYKSRPPIIGGLLYGGAYILAGAPKIGKSFLVAQIAYHVSTGEKLWEFEVHQGTVLYLALEDDYQRIQSRMFMMYGVEDSDKLHFATAANKIGMNVHFKTPTTDYTAMFDQMVADGTISTRGLKADAEKFGELIFDVNSAYFYNNGGYDFAKQFYAEAYKSAIEIVGGEQYILSAVMHADERNRAMSEALGEDVYHYHLHVVYIPVVEKEIRWSKRCKDEALRGTVKERIMQVSMSKKWDSKPARDENGQELRSKSGKPVLKKSYSVLQDDFFNHMIAAGYHDIQRGERGSSEEHLTVTQFKVEREQERPADLTEQTQQKEAEAAALDKQLEKTKQKKVDIESIDKIEAKPVMLSPSRVSLEKSEYETLSTAAKKYYAQEKKESKLQKLLDAANKMIEELKSKIKSLIAENSSLRDELSKYKSVRNRLNSATLEQENERLRNRVRTYEEVISQNKLWHLFGKGRGKTHTRDDAR